MRLHQRPRALASRDILLLSASSASVRAVSSASCSASICGNKRRKSSVQVIIVTIERDERSKRIRYDLLTSDPRTTMRSAAQRSASDSPARSRLLPALDELVSRPCRLGLSLPHVALDAVGERRREVQDSGGHLHPVQRGTAG